LGTASESTEIGEVDPLGGSVASAGYCGGMRDWAGGPKKSGDGQLPPENPRREEQGDLATETRRKVARPKRYKVLLYNDNYTSMEFVVLVLEQIFEKGPSEATQIMLQIHHSGMGVAGVFVLEIAETKVSRVHQLAEERGYPLRAGVEQE
jgi:ATP-dependent Clp protease adaptor protein ClpS